MRYKFLFGLILLPMLSLCQEIHYGLTVGANFSRWVGDNESFANSLSNDINHENGLSGFAFNGAPRTGISLGFFVDLPIKKSLSIQPEISFVQKGSTFSGDGNYSDLSVHTKMIYQFDYVDLVLLAKYSVFERNIKPYLIAGPGISSLVSSRLKVKATVDGETDTQSEKIDVGEKMDVNLNFGGGINFSDQIRLEYRYSLGFVRIHDDARLNLRNGVNMINLVANF